MHRMTCLRRFVLCLLVTAVPAVKAADAAASGDETTGEQEPAEAQPQRNDSARAPAEPPRPVEEIVVLGRGEELGLGAVRIPKEESARRPTATVAAMLEQEPAVVVSSNSRGERLIHFRGFEQKQLRLLVDGVPVAIPYDGLVNLDMLPSWLVDHLTIVKSPGAAVYGPNGLGGAINIVTRKPGEGPLFSGSISGGRTGDAGLQASHSWQGERFAYSVFGGYGRRDAWALPAGFTPTATEDGGLRQNSDKWSYHLGINSELGLGSGHGLTAGVLFCDAAFGVPPATSGDRPRFWRFTHWRMTKLSVGHRYHSGELQGDEVIYGLLFDNLLDSYDDATYSSQETRRAFHSWYHDRTLGGQAKIVYDRQTEGEAALRLGLWLGVQNDRHAEEQRGQDSPPLRQRTLLTLAPRVEAFPAEGWSLGVGLQIDSEFPGGDNASSARLGPSVFVSWKPASGFALQASVAHQGRFPTLRERFSSAPGKLIANPLLDPESAWHFNLEASWQPWRGVDIGAGAFDAEVADLIEKEPVGNGVAQPQNIGSARFWGIELSLGYQPRHWLSVQAAYSYLNARHLDGADSRLEYRPAHKAVGQVVVQPLRGWELRLQAIYTAAVDYRDPFSGDWGRLAGWFELRARTSFALGAGWALWIEGENLADSYYETEYGQPAPGFFLAGGLEYAWNRPEG